MAPATKKKPSKPVKPQKAPKKVQIVPIKEDSTSESEEEEAPQLQQLQLDGSDSDLSSDGDDQLADDFLQGSDDEDEDNYGEGIVCIFCSICFCRYSISILKLCFDNCVYVL